MLGESCVLWKCRWGWTVKLPSASVCARCCVTLAGSIILGEVVVEVAAADALFQVSLSLLGMLLGCSSHPVCCWAASQESCQSHWRCEQLRSLVSTSL